MAHVFVVTLNPAIDITYELQSFVLGTTNRVNHVWRTPGGKGLNVLRVLHELSVPSSGVGFVAGNAGNWVLETTQRLGVAFEGVMVSGETRSTVAVVDEKGMRTTELIEPGPEVSPEEAAKLLDHVAWHTRPGDYVLLSGSQTQGLSVDFSAKLVRSATNRGCLVCIDTSGAVLEEALKENPYIVKINDSEFRALVGNREDSSLAPVLKAAEELIRAGSKLVVVTQGASGSLVVSETGRWLVFAPHVSTRNSVGSGDAFFAGLIGGLANGMELLDALAQATSCGASNAMFPVAGAINPNDIPNLVQQVKIQSVD